MTEMFRSPLVDETACLQTSPRLVMRGQAPLLGHFSIPPSLHSPLFVCVVLLAPARLWFSGRSNSHLYNVPRLFFLFLDLARLVPMRMAHSRATFETTRTHHTQPSSFAEEVSEESSVTTTTTTVTSAACGCQHEAGCAIGAIGGQLLAGDNGNSIEVRERLKELQGRTSTLEQEKAREAKQSEEQSEEERELREALVASGGERRRGKRGGMRGEGGNL